jgi:hypothetical protein
MFQFVFTKLVRFTILPDTYRPVLNCEEKNAINFPGATGKPTGKYFDHFFVRQQNQNCSFLDKSKHVELLSFGERVKKN